MLKNGLGERIFRGIEHALGLVEADGVHAQQLEGREDRLAHMAEGHRAVVRIAARDEHMAVEAVHFRDGKYADAAEGLRIHGQHLALRHIGSEHAILVALQAEEGDAARDDIAFQRTARDVRLAAIF